MKKMRENIRKVFASQATLRLDVQDMIKTLNPKVIGMRNYYGLKNAGKQLNITKCCRKKNIGKPYEEKLHVRFDKKGLVTPDLYFTTVA